MPALVRFANLDDGWVLGSDLWATHDGGAHWAKQDLPGSPAQVTDVEAAGGKVNAVGIQTSGPSIVIETSPVHQDAWQASPTKLPLGAGPIPVGRIVLQGSAGWIIENDRVVVAGARLLNGSWVPWQPPCTRVGGRATLAASSPRGLVAVCSEGMFGDPPVGVRAYLSADGGLTFRKAPRDLPLRDLTAAASPAPGVFFAAGTDPAGQGAAPRLVANRDGGSTWMTVYRGPSEGAVTELGFTSATQGVAIQAGPSLQGATLLMTHDGGNTWQPVPLTAAGR